MDKKNISKTAFYEGQRHLNTLHFVLQFFPVLQEQGAGREYSNSC